MGKRIVSLYGVHGIGKSTLCLELERRLTSLGIRCKYFPSCTKYAVESIRRITGYDILGSNASCRFLDYCDDYEYITGGLRGMYANAYLGVLFTQMCVSSYRSANFMLALGSDADVLLFDRSFDWVCYTIWLTKMTKPLTSNECDISVDNCIQMLLADPLLIACNGSLNYLAVDGTLGHVANSPDISELQVCYLYTDIGSWERLAESNDRINNYSYVFRSISKVDMLLDIYDFVWTTYKGLLSLLGPTCTVTTKSFPVYEVSDPVREPLDNIFNSIVSEPACAIHPDDAWIVGDQT